MDKPSPCPCESKNGQPKDGVTRRGFLAGLAAGCSALIALILGGSGLTYFVSPAFKKDEETWVDLGPVGDVKPGAPVKVDYVARKRDAWEVQEKRASAWISTSDGKTFTAFDPRCTHLGCPYRWSADKQQFLCPCHDAVFAKDGSVVSGPPPRPLDRFETKVEQGRLLIQPQAKKGVA